MTITRRRMQITGKTINQKMPFRFLKAQNFTNYQSQAPFQVSRGAQFSAKSYLAGKNLQTTSRKHYFS